MSVKQLARLVKYERDIPPGIIFQYSEDDLTRWVIHIRGNDLYNNLWFQAEINLDGEEGGIEVKFNPELAATHPNIDGDGLMCIEIPKNTWLLPLAIGVQTLLFEPDYDNGYGIVHQYDDPCLDCLTEHPALVEGMNVLGLL